ncbi:hypothetical protein NN561_015560 [Cricetulus griseus]
MLCLCFFGYRLRGHERLRSHRYSVSRKLLVAERPGAVSDVRMRTITASRRLPNSWNSDDGKSKFELSRVWHHRDLRQARRLRPLTSRGALVLDSLITQDSVVSDGGRWTKPRRPRTSRSSGHEHPVSGVPASIRLERCLSGPVETRNLAESAIFRVIQRFLTN